MSSRSISSGVVTVTDMTGSSTIGGDCAAAFLSAIEAAMW